MKADWISGAPGGQSSGTRDVAAREELPAGAACPPFAEPLPVAPAPLAARLPAVDVDDVVFAIPARELPVMPEKAPVCEPVPELAVPPPLPAADAGAEDAAAEEEEPEPVPPVGVMAAAEPGEAGSWPVICPAAGAAAAASAAETSSAEPNARIRTLLPFPLCRPRAGRLVLKRTGW
ncbi:MAG TPA: hypothetical protein VGD08_12320 [Stellaceae bacterium]